MTRIVCYHIVLFLFAATGSALGQNPGDPVNINGNFEEAEPGLVTDLEGIDGWVLRVGGSVDTPPEFQIVEDPVQDGSHALKVTLDVAGEHPWSVEATADGIPAEPGAAYRYSIWARSDADGCTANFTVGNYDTDDSPGFQEYGRIGSDVVDLTQEWQQFTFEFTVTDSETLIRAPVHLNFEENVGKAVYIDNLQIINLDDFAKPIIVEAESGEIGQDFDVLEDDGITFVRITNDWWDVADPPGDQWQRPISEDHVITYEVTFPEGGEYNLFVRGRVGPGGADDDSFFYPEGFGQMDIDEADDWRIANQLDNGGFTDPENVVDGPGAAGTQIWKWLNISTGDFHDEGITFTVDEEELNQVFQIGGRETDFDIDRFAFGRADLYFTVANLDNVTAGSAEPPTDPVPDPTGPPLADGLDKFLGNVYSGNAFHDQHFHQYWNQVTPENAGKWGSVQPNPDPDPETWNWTALDNAYNLARDNGFPFRFHVLVWGNQQPPWMQELEDSPEEQLEAIENWFRAVAERYGEIDYLEVVNEPLHDPPTHQGDGQGGAYIEALGGTGETGWDWVLNAFRTAREVFPEDTKLMINEYSILSSDSNTQTYLEIIELLQEESLIDGIGVQGHAFSTRGPVSSMVQRLDMLAETGLPVQVTEFDLDGNPNQIANLPQEDSDATQLSAYQRVFPSLWEHPAVEGMTLWGWKPGMWRTSQEAYLVRADGSERPAMEWLRDFLAGEITGAGEHTESVREFRLFSNYPNPFNPSTQIEFHVSRTAEVTLRVYDTMGRHVETLVDGVKSPGEYQVTFHADHLATGTYFYRLETGSFVQVKPMILVK